MLYKVVHTKEEGLAQITDLVNAFALEGKAFRAATYNETQFRNDFLDPFLMSFGWDVKNEYGKTQFLRDVIQEESISVEDELSKKSPDYTLRVQGIRKLFVEAKKPSVDIGKSSKSGFQTRRYGWNANLGISVLSNFDKLVIYDCRYKPDAKDDEHVARVCVFDFGLYITGFNEIYDLISFESASSGRLDDLFSVYDRVGETFDSYFLQQIEHWREKLGQSAIKRNASLGSEKINFLIQRLLNRIVFLRICEDRTIEKYETLKNIRDYAQLKALFQLSDQKYNSGLFNFIEDNLSLNIEIDAEVLIEIFNDLYYPLSPYDFAVVDPTILSQIYEKFLGSQIALDGGRQMSIVIEPEVVASNGVVPTPKLIVEQIVEQTLSPLINGKSSTQLAALKIADICCGSGTFLISVYDYLVKVTIQKYLDENVKDPELIFELPDHTIVLTLKAKRHILENNIYGVDINPYAVEVTEFSLLLKLLEGESGITIGSFIGRNARKILPEISNNIKCGNSLVDDKFFNFKPDALDNNQLLFRVKPFEWAEEFPFLAQSNGFDAIIGNPPYVRIQNLVKYAPEEIKYYQSPISGYAVASNETIDKYYVFIERAISLLNPTGYLGYIIPHKFFIIKGGKALRKFITQSSYLSKIIHFGITQVFPDRSTYTAILVLQMEQKEQFEFKRIRKINADLLASKSDFIQYPNDEFAEDPWVFLSTDTAEVFRKIRSSQTVLLKSLAEITVGVQTSKDKIYIFVPKAETGNTYQFIYDGKPYEVEKAICKPCIYDLSFAEFDTIASNAQMIFPYHIADGKAEVFSTEYFENQFPLAWAYLNDYKEALQARKISGKDPKFYQFGRSQSLVKFHDSPKLIWPVLSTKPSYVYDTNNIQFTGGGNGPYYCLLNNSEYSILYLMGILTHPIIERMVKAGASEFRGAYYSHGKQFLENIPIRVIDQNNQTDKDLYGTIVNAVTGLIKTKAEANESFGSNLAVLKRKLLKLETTLIAAVNQLYQISEEEFNTVLNDEMFSGELIAEVE
ncbi:MAG: Eco57I restriction-modification methylase domain-containing protein [Mucilaginibacter sp.]